jgi:alcohol dehydrogenase class IV
VQSIREFGFTPPKQVMPVIAIPTTAGSGIDALTHAPEACLTDQATAITTAIALQAMQMLMKNLRTC